MALTDDLIAWWTLDEESGVRVDSHTNGLDLADNNTVGFAAGKQGNAADFEKSNTEYLSHADHSLLRSGDIDFSIAFWVHLESLPSSTGNQGYHLVNKWGGSTNEYTANVNNATDRFRLDYNGGNATSAVTLATATWYFVVMWHDSAADTLNIQVNDGTVESNAHAGGNTAGNSGFKVGSLNGAAGFHDGLLDEVAIWKRVLTSAERTELYNGGAGVTYDDIVSGITHPIIGSGIVNSRAIIGGQP